jgi:hypothetical protein
MEHLLAYAEDSREHFEHVKLWWNVGLTLAIGALAWNTYQIAKLTRALSIDAEASSGRQIGAQMWLEFSKRFDSLEMRRARVNLAAEALLHNKLARKGYDQQVHNFFEDLGAAIRQDLINKELAEGTFRYCAVRWWIVMEEQILWQREQYFDRKLFSNFEYLVKHYNEAIEVVHINEVRDFIRAEMTLNISK